jgi:hypothetical protein
MKSLLVVLTLLLSSCSFIFPVPHDPVMFDQLVAIDIAVNKASCVDKHWDDLLTRVNHLKIYTELRKDPQAESMAQLSESLQKAYGSKNEKFCESIININKVRIQTVQKAWRGR